jgi:hypothetical protein
MVASEKKTRQLHVLVIWVKMGYIKRCDFFRSFDSSFCRGDWGWAGGLANASGWKENLLALFRRNVCGGGFFSDGPF